MSLDSTTRPTVPNWLPGAILGAALLIAGIGYTLISHAAPAPTPVAAPVPTLHEYSNAAASTGASAASGGTSAEPDHGVAAATGVGICHDMQGCLDSQLLSVFPSIHEGHHEWEASYRFTMQSGPRMFEVDDLDPATGHVLRQVDAWSEGQS